MLFEVVFFNISKIIIIIIIISSSSSSSSIYFNHDTNYIICTYQNSKLAHIRLDVAKVSSCTLHVGHRVSFVKRTRGGTCKTKISNAQVSM